jgi:hypothetical protein
VQPDETRPAACRTKCPGSGWRNSGIVTFFAGLPGRSPFDQTGAKSAPHIMERLGPASEAIPGPVCRPLHPARSDAGALMAQLKFGTGPSA